MQAVYDALLAALTAACRQHYGDRLLSVAVYGSVGRGMPRPDSDVDVLIVAHGLADRHFHRLRDFRAVEDVLRARIDAARTEGLQPELSPVLMTRAELRRGSMLLLDMTEDARILFDPEGCLAGALDRLRRPSPGAGLEARLAGQRLVLGSEARLQAGRRLRPVRTMTNTSASVIASG